MAQVTNYDYETMKTWNSFDLYNKGLWTEDSILRRWIVMTLKERKENDYIYSLAVNYA